MDNYFSGEYFNTLDEKGRIAFPARLRSILSGDTIWITKGMDDEKTLVIYTPDLWKKTLEEMQQLSVYNRQTRWLYRRFISPAREITIDKNGRVAIPQNLREYAGLQKECVFLGMNTIIELWDVDTYRQASGDEESQVSFEIFDSIRQPDL
jgi:MraZ protein